MGSESENETTRALLEEHTRRVLQRYEYTCKNFRRLLGVLIGFALLFFFFIVLFPYVSMQNENYRINEKLESVPAEIAERNRIIEAFQQTGLGIIQLREQIERGPQSLRSRILELEKMGAQGIPQEQGSHS